MFPLTDTALIHQFDPVIYTDYEVRHDKKMVTVQRNSYLEKGLTLDSLLLI